MEEENAPNQILRACLTCGRWMTLQADSKQVYCSPDCARENEQCLVCERVFPKGTGIDGCCSPECAEKHPEYDDLFKETP